MSEAQENQRLERSLEKVTHSRHPSALGQTSYVRRTHELAVVVLRLCTAARKHDE